MLTQTAPAPPFHPSPPTQVTSYTLPLREIDTVQGDDGADGGYVPNALEVVVRKRHLGMLEVRGVGGGEWE